ncbi:PqqD family protein [Deltaproteobacteria bacterium TL4]
MSQRLQHLAINNEGFIFDPTTGESFTVNQTGIVGITGLKEGKSLSEIADQFADQFEVTADQAEKDLTDFVNLLRTYRLLLT